MGAPENDEILKEGKIPCKQTVYGTKDEANSEKPSRKKHQNYHNPVRSQNRRKRQGVRTKRRIENTNFLLSLLDNEEYGEVPESDYLSSEPTCFEQLFLDEESMQIWNNFINQTGEEQERFLDQLDGDVFHSEKIDDQKENLDKDEEFEELAPIADDEDKRKEHPAYSGSYCYKRINRKIRNVLRQKNFPKDSLQTHEEELLLWFTDDPKSIWISQLPNNFERLKLHAISQYMDLQSSSYDCNGKRQTKVENNHTYFNPPVVLLSQYLESLS